MSTLTTLCDDVIWAEAPRWRDGVLWSSDAQARQLISIDATGVQRLRLDSPVNGTWFLPDGRMAATRMHEQRIDVLCDGAFAPYADLRGLCQGSLGDMTGTPDGHLYLDDIGADAFHGRPSGRVLAIAPDGSARVAADELTFPNGMAVIDDGSTLIVAETFAARLTAFDLDRNGGLSNRRTWVDLAADFGPQYRPDGIWPAPDDTVWVATTTGAAFLRLNHADAVDRVDVPGEFAIACCLTDSTLYLSASHSTDPTLSILEEALPQKKVRGRIAVAELSGLPPVRLTPYP